MTDPTPTIPLEDVQNAPSPHAVPIDRVGIKNFRMPLVVKDMANTFQHTVATVDIGVDLPAAFKGTHMSRFVEALENFRQSTDEHLDYSSLKELLKTICRKLDSRKAFISFSFPYFLNKQAPITCASAQVAYDCSLVGEYDTSDNKTSFLIEITVPVTTVCPCSKAISRDGAHGQRTQITMQIKLDRFTWLEEFIHLAESSGSAPIYALLKRADEKAVTEQAYDNAFFVEDVVRNVASKLEKHEHVTWFKVDVESQESIHGHNAYAVIEYTN